MADIPMSIDTYQQWTRTTAQYPESRRFTYPICKLNSEAGEPNELLMKLVRLSKPPINEFDLVWPHRDEFADELGDVLWYVARAADELGFTMSDLIQRNVAKLTRRKREGTITAIKRDPE